MEGAFVGGAIGGLFGAIMAFRTVTRRNAKVRERDCPNCDEPLDSSKPGPQTFKQVLWGGLTCGNCGCDVDRHGNERDE